MADLLGIGKTGLNASKKALEVTGHNLANVNTEGFSRQRVMQSTAIPVSVGGFIHGTGTKIDGIRRFNDEFIDKRLNNALANNKFYEARTEHLGQVENIFNELDSDGLNQVINKFFNSFRELANQPENETIRSVVRDTANLVIKDFRRIRGTLDTQANNIDRKIENSVADVNQTLNHIADLNGKITSIESAQGETGDLRDQRDMALRNLSEHFKVHTYVDEKNRFIITAQGIGTLVTGLQVQELGTISKNKLDSSNNMNGSVEVVLKDRPSQKITNEFKGGTLAAIIKVRNEDLRKLQDDIDGIAYQFTTSVNTIHRQGFVNRPITIGADGKPALLDKKGLTTGLDFFKQPTQVEEAGTAIDLSDAVKLDLSNISAGLTPNSPGDNRVAIAISKLQHERISGEGSVTLEEKYLQTIGNIGLETGKARLDSEQATGILAQAHSLRERLTGVSIDEETANMVRFQQAYQASAKIMQAADEMFKTVLDIKR
ncbi:MAG: flagellar hook-associated protein FlgK [Bacteriovoracaceae bacterium]|nr:flagellar hook-associated protein FlgK [Bacteriovoracaceae bacterium]